MPYLVTADTPGRIHTATIALSGSLSAAVAIPLTHNLVGLVMPAAWDAADLTFQGSFDGTTYGNLYTTRETKSPSQPTPATSSTSATATSAPSLPEGQIRHRAARSLRPPPALSP